MNDKKKSRIIAIAEFYEDGDSVLKNIFGRVIAGLGKSSQEFIDYAKKTETWEKDKLKEDK